MKNLLPIFFVAGMFGAAQGASIFYLNNSGVTDLSDGAAWDGGVAPGPDDVAVFAGAIPTTLTIPDGTACPPARCSSSDKPES